MAVSGVDTRYMARGLLLLKHPVLAVVNVKHAASPCDKGL